MVANDAATALQDVLSAYHPQQVANVVEQLATVIDKLADRSSYRHLKDDPSAQRVFKQSLLAETSRMGILPKGKAGVEFVERLIAYVNEWMI